MSASLDLVFSGVINVSVIRTVAKDLVLRSGKKLLFAPAVRTPTSFDGEITWGHL